MNDVGMHLETFPHMWAVIVDKGYQQSLEIVHEINPIRRTPRGALSLSDEGFNRNVSSDQVLVENYFGRLSKLWTLCSSKGRWSLRMYDEFLRLQLDLQTIISSQSPCELMMVPSTFV